MIYCVALPFVRIEGGFAPAEPVECPHAGAAVRRAEAMSRNPANSRERFAPHLHEFSLLPLA